MHVAFNLPRSLSNRAPSGSAGVVNTMDMRAIGPVVSRSADR